MRHVDLPATINKTNPVIAVFPLKSMVHRPDLEAFSQILAEEISAELSFSRHFCNRAFLF